MGVSKKDLRRILAGRPRVAGTPRGKANAVPEGAPVAHPMEPTDRNVAAALADGIRCVHCGSADHWHGGPRGGMHQNMTCGCCGQGVNACARLPELSHALNERTDLAVRAAYEAEGGTVRDRMGHPARSLEPSGGDTLH